MVDWIKASIKSLSASPVFGSRVAACEEISQHSGVSVSAILKIYDGRSDNPTADTIDRLVSAIRQAEQKAAA